MPSQQARRWRWCGSPTTRTTRTLWSSARWRVLRWVTSRGTRPSTSCRRVPDAIAGLGGNGDPVHCGLVHSQPRIHNPFLCSQFAPVWAARRPAARVAQLCWVSGPSAAIGLPLGGGCAATLACGWPARLEAPLLTGSAPASGCAPPAGRVLWQRGQRGASRERGGTVGLQCEPLLPTLLR